MSLESYTGNIADLVVTNPQPTDPKSQGDDHLRGIKYTLKQTFPNFTGPLNATRVPFTPSGTIGATNVQAAIAELDGETQTALAVGLNTPMLKAHLESFTNTVAGSTQFVNPTVDWASGINNASGTFTPTVPGWYQCSINALCIGTTDALGLAIVATNDSFIQIQPPYATNNAYASAGGLTYCNGTTDTIKFGVFGSVTGCSFNNIKTSAVLVRKA